MLNTSTYFIAQNNFINVFKQITLYFTSVYIIWIAFFLGITVAKFFDFEMAKLSAFLIFLPFGFLLFIMYIILVICYIKNNRKYKQMDQLVTV